MLWHLTTSTRCTSTASMGIISKEYSQLAIQLQRPHWTKEHLWKNRKVWPQPWELVNPGSTASAEKNEWEELTRCPSGIAEWFGFKRSSGGLGSPILLQQIVTESVKRHEKDDGPCEADEGGGRE